ncbi:MAG: SDR family oxidoreductase [Bacteroidales bacterium]|nr:SDR family oxidoreductase [Bacteroidales bacterium]MCB9012460.1 SDR family oxidoreductase [Bacteroidales bacterium]
MKVLFIGGTGNISSAVSELAIKKGIDLYHLNRGNRPALKGVQSIFADINDKNAVEKAIIGHHWDVVVNWIAFRPEDVVRDLELFEGKTSQYIFISSASAYQKPPKSKIITEETPLENPFWDYSRNKIACEEQLMKFYHVRNFPVTIVRPSHTYNTVIPVPLGAWEEYTLIDRMKKGLPVIIHDNGKSLWTLTHALDFAKGFLGLMNNPMSIGEAFHITSDEVMNWNQIYQEIAVAAGCEGNFVHIPSDFIADFADNNNYESRRGTLLGDKAYDAVFDNGKIKSLLPDFHCSIPFAEGIRKTLEWFEAEPSRMKIKKETNEFLDGVINSFRG